MTYSNHIDTSTDANGPCDCSCQVKSARLDPVRRKTFDRIQPRSCRIPTGESDGNPNKIRPNPITTHRILSDSDDIRTGIRPSDRMSWDVADNVK